VKRQAAGEAVRAQCVNVGRDGAGDAEDGTHMPKRRHSWGTSRNGCSESFSNRQFLLTTGRHERDLPVLDCSLSCDQKRTRYTTAGPE